MFVVDAYNLAYSTGKAISFNEAYRMALEIAHVLMRKGYRSSSSLTAKRTPPILPTSSSPAR